MSISETDWSDDSPFKPLANFNFFAYSGSDGDLFRKHGIAGWRVSVHGRHRVRIQEKGDYWKGTQYWNTVREWEVDFEESLSVEQIGEIEESLAELVENETLE